MRRPQDSPAYGMRETVAGESLKATDCVADTHKCYLVSITVQHAV